MQMSQFGTYRGPLYKQDVQVVTTARLPSSSSLPHALTCLVNINTTKKSHTNMGVTQCMTNHLNYFLYLANAA